MPQKPLIDVSIAFYGKPYQTIVTIESLMRHSGQHIDTIYISRERLQAHNDWVGIFKVIDVFRNRTINGHLVKLKINFPYHFLGVGAVDYARAKTDARFRKSILYQYALEETDKNYLCLVHNDMLFHDDIIGHMLQLFSKSDSSVVGVGSIGQCWSCPAGPDWGNVCGPEKQEQYVPTQAEAVALQKKYATPRQELNLKILGSGRVHPLPECRLNEFCALINVPIYRANTLPNGPVGCFGGNWHGTDTGTIWSHDMYQLGYRFRHVSLEDYARHAPFDATGSGTSAHTKVENYTRSEKNAKEYIVKNFYPLEFSSYVAQAAAYDTLKRTVWLSFIHSYGFFKKLLRR